VKPKLKYILKEHGHDFIKKYGSELSAYVVSVILAVMDCGTVKSGYRSFFCPDCGQLKRIPFSCKKRLCPSCSQWANREFAINFVQRMLPFTHRHLTMSIPDVFWGMVHDNPEFQKGLMRAAYVTVRQTMMMYLGVEVMPGMMGVLHNFGRDLKKNCHVHVIVTEGGYFGGKWYQFMYFPFMKGGRIKVTMNELWRDNVIEMLRLSLPRTKNNSIFLDGVKRRYPNGFYIFGDKSCRIKSNRNAYNKAKYITRYVRHPPISDNRILQYDGESVTIWWDHPSSGVREYATYPVLEFLYRVIMHLPELGLNVVVYYGMYSPRYVQVSVVQGVFDSDGAVVDPKYLSWRSMRMLQTGVDPLACPHCRREMIEVYLVYKTVKGYKMKSYFHRDDLSGMGYPLEIHFISSMI